MRKTAILLLLIVLFSTARTSVWAQVRYEDVVEKIHYTHPRRGMGSHDLYDARKELGPESAILRMYIWGDLGERFTKSFFTTTFPTLKSKYGDEMYFIYNHRAFLLMDKNVQAGMVGECAAQQGKFWDNIIPIVSNIENLGQLDYLQGVDNEKIRQCLADPYTKTVVHVSEEDGKYFGFNSVPTFVIQNTQNPQAYSLKISGAQDMAIFERAIAEAKDGDLTKKDLDTLEAKVANLEQDVKQTKEDVQTVKEKQNILVTEIEKIKELLQTILQRFSHLLGGQ